MISLILCTVDTWTRKAEITRLLNSLKRQSYKNFEVVVVDQNENYDIDYLLSPFSNCLSITHVRSARGLSRARNVGLCHVSGDIVGFPDDDCWYASNLLADVDDFFRQRLKYCGYFGKARDDQGRDIARFDEGEGEVTRYNVFERAASITMFYRKVAIDRVGGFDESLGVGSGGIWTSGEDYDLPLRVIASGDRLYYQSSLIVNHPCPFIVDSATLIARARHQAPGFGHLLVQHRFPLWFVSYKLFRPLGGVILSMVLGKVNKAKYHFAVLTGRIRGVMTSMKMI